MGEQNETEISIERLFGLLSASIGDAKAEDAIRAAVGQLGLSKRTSLTMKEALEVLEAVAETPGIVGVTARFAKSRLHLAAR